MHENGQSHHDPDLLSGQIWVIGQTSDGSSLSVLVRQALVDADVVLYDRALAPLIADLPYPCRYAEPLPADVQHGSPAISARALKLASEGWSVVQLSHTHRGWRRRLRAAADALVPPHWTGSFPVRIMAQSTVGPCRDEEARFCRVAELVEGAPEDELLTLIVGPLAGGSAAAAYGFTANGVAG